MKILMVLEGEFPPDERVEKEIKSLQEKGFDVCLAVYTRSHRKETEKYNSYTIYRKKLSSLLYKSSAAILLHPFYFRFWYRFLDALLSMNKYDIIHVHDLPLAKIGYKLARKYKLKLVCDQHEFYSNWIIRTKHYNTFSGKIIKYLSNWKRYEKKYLKKADLVITVEESLKEIYKDHIGISEKKLVALPNTPSMEYFRADYELDKNIRKEYSNRFILFYAGGLDHIRGIDFILETVSELKNSLPEVLFLIAGKENKAFNLAFYIKKYQIADHVKYVGWVPLNLLSSYIAASDVCLFVPQADNIEINNTIATKIYQYAAMGKPCIVSEARMMKKFVLSNEIGFSVKFGNIEELCEVILEIFNNRGISASIREKAIQIARNYTWEITSSEFLNYYAKFN